MTPTRHLRPEEKLAVLREADTFRKWFSLDDRRICVLCDRTLSGRMIDIWQDERGVYHLHCPTPGCDATPRDWFHHGAASRGRRRKVRPSPAPAINFGTALLT